MFLDEKVNPSHLVYSQGSEEYLDFADVNSFFWNFSLELIEFQYIRYIVLKMSCILV